jgi:hypothetical protein
VSHAKISLKKEKEMGLFFPFGFCCFFFFALYFVAVLFRFVFVPNRDQDHKKQTVHEKVKW